MPRPLSALLCLVMACSGGGAHSNSGPPQAAVRSTPSEVMTPGLCGIWETADSASRESCRQSLANRGPQPIGLLAAGDCAYEETKVLDSLKACFARVDSNARRCPVAYSWEMRQADGVTRAAEWRRCGPQDGAYSGDSIIWPVHFLLIRRDTLNTSPLIFSYSNVGEPGAGGIDTALVIDLDGDRTDELFFVDHAYGTGAMFEPCALAVTAGRFQCWKGPVFPGSDVLSSGELFYKGWVPMYGGPEVERESAGPIYATGKSLWYFTPIYREGDANCCPTSGASLWVEARPRNGQFETGLVLRVREDSNQVVIGADTLHP